MKKEKPLIMGVVNVTPDSFSDGGHFLDSNKAIAHAMQLLEEGADVLDIGAESSRPGALPVDQDTEWQRLEPVIRALVTKGCPVSVDTCKPELMKRSADLGVRFINCIQGLADEETLRTLAGFDGLQYCAMHMHRDPATMQLTPLSGQDAVQEVTDFFEASFGLLKNAGFTKERIWLDPGIGFGKDDAANAQLMRKIPDWSHRYQLLLGVSRKSFIGRTLDIAEAADRDDASKMLEFGLICAGAGIIRTHNVRALKRLTSLLGE